MNIIVVNGWLTMRSSKDNDGENNNHDKKERELKR